MKKSILALLLAVLMVASLLPAAALADGEIGTMAELQDALNSAQQGDTVTMTGDVTVSNTSLNDITSAVITVPAGVTLDGDDHKIIADKETWVQRTNGKGETVNANHILRVEGGSTVEDLTIVGTGYSKSGIHAYKCTEEVTLTNVTIQGCGEAGMIVNGSLVKATDLTTRGNAWGAVNVDKGDNVTTAASFELVSGDLTENTKIWSENDSASEITVPKTWAKVNGSSVDNYAPISSLGDEVVYNETKEEYYLTLAYAINQADEKDVLSLLGDVNSTSTITINKSLTINGNNNTVRVTGDDAVTIDADNVTLNNLNVESAHQIALIVNNGKKNPTITGGSYKTCTETGGYNEDYGKQGEGAMRFMGDNGDITVTGVTAAGGLHFLNRGEGNLNVTGNTIGFDYEGNTALVGIIVHGNDTGVDMNELMANNEIVIPNANSQFVQISDASWQNQEYIPAVDGIAAIGARYFNDLQLAIDEVEANGTIEIINEPAAGNYEVPVNADFKFEVAAGVELLNVNFVTESGHVVVIDKDGNVSVKETWKVTLVYSDYSKEIIEVIKGSEYKLPTPTRAGYAFLGWVSGGKTYSGGDTVTITADTTYTATWVRHPDTPYVPEPEEPEEPEVPAFPFYDVPTSAWYYTAVKFVYDNKLMDGVDTYEFAPNDTLTRAMVWTIIARMSGVDTTGGNTWYAKAQEWVITNGISDGENPTAAITRQELVTMLYRYAQIKGYDVSVGESTNILSYVDATSISEYAMSAFQWACGSGLTEGDENGALTPLATATRAQAAAMIMRFLSK